MNRTSIATYIVAALAGALLTLTGCGMPKADTPLTLAADSGDAAEVRALLASGADPDGPDSFGLTPLVRASRRGHVEVVKALLAGGAHADLTDRIPSREGWTPLMNAVHKNQLEVVKALIAAGADVNARTSGGVTALMLASGDADPAVVKALLDAGADPRPGSGGSAALTNAVAAGEIETVKALLARAPDLELERGLRGSGALWLARIRGRREVAVLVAKARRLPSDHLPR